MKEAPDYRGRAEAIYDESYAARYPELYIAPWRRKHERNVRVLARLLDGMAATRPRWLDVACGQAWHFRSFQGSAAMTGLDLSMAQLRRARQQAPHSSFVRADMLAAPFAASAFDLVTSFWGAYCYLGSHRRIGRLLAQMLRWLRPGGALYMEVLLPGDLESFNRSRFASSTGFAVSSLSEQHGTWSYDDPGGRHLMSSPPLDFFLDALGPAFGHVSAEHDGDFMVHLVATGRVGRAAPQMTRMEA